MSPLAPSAFAPDMPLDPLARSVLGRIRATKCLPEGGRVVVGLSGGPDSLCLLHVLLALAPVLGLEVEAAHLHHGLRGETADGDEAFVRRWCEDRGVPLTVRRVDVAALAAATGRSLETCGRDERYAFLAGVAGVDGRIAVAHHRDDQAETLLMNLCRGSGLDGLRGMRPLSGSIARPLLDVPRSDILAYLDRNGLTYREDPTNAEAVATRNRVRLEVMPLLASVFGASVGESIAATAGLLAEDAACLDDIADRTMDALRRNGSVDCAAMRPLPSAVASRIVRRLYRDARGDRKDLGRRATAAVLSLCAAGRANGPAGTVSLPGGFEARVRRGRLSIVPSSADGPVRSEEGGTGPVAGIRREAWLEFPGCVVTDDGWRVTARWIENPVEMVYNSMAWCFRVDTTDGCTVRSRRTGDSLRPEGGSGRRSLKRLLIDRRIPREDRDGLLVFAIGPEVLWVPGVAVDARHSAKGEKDHRPSGHGRYVGIALERDAGRDGASSGPAGKDGEDEPWPRS